MNIDNIKQSIKSLEEETNSLQGKVSLLEEQYTSNLNKIEHLKDLEDSNAKGIEILNFIQQTTSEVIKNAFENIVTNALQYVHQDNGYEFKLNFGKRGNNPELKFNLKTPEMQEEHDIVTTREGGAKDIIALALRQVLLEVSHNTGFLFLDEPFKRLDNEETEKNAMEFIKELQRESGRQILLITHKPTVVDSVPNPIIFKKKKFDATK